MKENIKFLMSILCFGLLLGACTKEGLRGPAGGAGDAGIPGPKGDQGLDGKGNANVLKYSFTVEKSAWVKENEGLVSECLAYEVTPANINNIDLSAADYTIFAYARPSEGHAQRKMLPFSYNYGAVATDPITTIRIDLEMGDIGENLKLTARKISFNGVNQISSAPSQVATNTEIAANIVFDIYLIKLTDPE